MRRPQDAVARLEQMLCAPCAQAFTAADSEKMLCLPMRAQAYGCGAYDALGVIFQRTCMFMLAHCGPITLVQLGVPFLLRGAGEDPVLCGLASQYALRLLPSLYIEAFSRCARGGTLCSCCSTRHQLCSLCPTYHDSAPSVPPTAALQETHHTPCPGLCTGHAAKSGHNLSKLPHRPWGVVL